MPPPELRIPALEILADRHGHRFGRSRRPLRQTEKDLARPIFLDSVDLEQVMIVETRFINAPTTLGNTIRVAPGRQLSGATLIHELTHIWQYQTQGNQYISSSACRQLGGTVAGFVKGAFHGRIDFSGRNAAYEYTIEPHKSFRDYTAEQQASIVEDYYRYPTLRHNRQYRRLIREVQQARPRFTPSERYRESLYGPAHLLNFHHQEMLQREIPGYLRDDQMAPILRFEWKF
ncbi:hypothetical protein [Lewinella sp. IMCC34191]|uniref:hypothetical protein n=1 Tax=Lewinella sp. IMCC34191 TaxID=2259172 RepID=UPI000E2389B3|nr:hypothetical protein [Lewinella sp. IMCC34191]